MAWNPDVYEKFKNERYQPFYDLVKLVHVKEGLNVIDLGCGTGELTAKLAEALPESNVLGIDSSAEMLEKAKSFGHQHLEFKQRTIEQVISEGSKYDLVFSNAALQWVDDHEVVFPQIISLLQEKGQVAIQIPSNHDHLTHRFIRELASESPYREALNSWVRPLTVLKIEDYGKLFFENGLKEICVFEKIYPHILQNADALYEWTSGTALIPYMEKLPEDLAQQFKEEYVSRLRKAFPESPVFYPFKRILMSGTLT
ncbi:trans-aconitate methyltransferase [Elizabethkingia meningoseptica]|uniref:Trans-aconitate methyltransferase n=1 Tax=Elizabethkingia meningoseptica TaxID=238 RepID=A0A1T3F4I7_ELIME|nr:MULTISPECIES: methyltransferase domain-containing protein [Elizabethkingia]AQX11459.1 trans-aconitate methyltransferase [Elizabethkingia meningoseptica]MBG0512807.1 methyltransferase domain-containing protein [Elizabethkingia meningoseptica]MDE5435409.1 methyltransferase domain-containing protein [Elizabethkingia meningoseptica]MDE5448311.1 methyltransferase domain-containing protein [Elizabethkingia meningoseptica]MDE5471950.1 methyltransferase domain-containing protein [Elizabethkingia me